VVMLRLLSEMAQDHRGVAVSIGRENPHDGLTEASVVATGYGPDSVAKIGVLGPTPHHHGRCQGCRPVPFTDPGTLTFIPAHWAPPAFPAVQLQALQQGRDTNFEQPLRRPWSLTGGHGRRDQEGLP
jgi:hypothetical protein